MGHRLPAAARDRALADDQHGRLGRSLHGGESAPGV
jgi:hypothetical protein